MNNYWWVNHKRTYTQETQEGYLWSPKKESDGRNSEFYNNMCKTKVGDRVISYADTYIKCIGTVAEGPSHSPKPISFANKGDHWSDEGWLVPVSWEFLQKPIKPKNFINEISILLPKKYSPISHKTGNGNQKAYLSQIDKKLFDFFFQKSNFDKALFSKHFLQNDFIAEVERLIEEDINDNKSLTETEKDRIIKARVGQGKFREDLFNMTDTCLVSGISNPKLLIASHIKPWRACKTNHERLDKYNGLLLAAPIDFLFDKGLISFNDSGNILVSSILSEREKEAFGIKNINMQILPFAKEYSTYLNYHRNEVFFK